MKHPFLRAFLGASLLWPVAFPSLPVCSPALAQDVNPRAVDDLKAGIVEFETAEKLFGEKKWAEAATHFAAADKLLIRADTRDSGIERATFVFPPDGVKAMRYYGYGQIQPMRMNETPQGGLICDLLGLRRIIQEMWSNAALLGGLDEYPSFSDEDGARKMLPLTEDAADDMVRVPYNPVGRTTLPVQDHEWHDLLLLARRSVLVMEAAFAKAPRFRTEQMHWGTERLTGEEALADAKAKAAEAEGEYKLVVAAQNKKMPVGLDTGLEAELRSLNDLLAKIKRDGYINDTFAFALFIKKDYLSGRRKIYQKMFADEGKTMPADLMKPLEAKVAQIRQTVDALAPKWKFPSKTHNAKFEAGAKARIKADFPGAVVLKTTMAGANWIIQKNDLDLPVSRSQGVLALVKVPGQKWHWVINVVGFQDYAGGGTYSQVAAFRPGFYELRFQTNK